MCGISLPFYVYRRNNIFEDDQIDWIKYCSESKWRVVKIRLVGKLKGSQLKSDICVEISDIVCDEE